MVFSGGLLLAIFVLDLGAREYDDRSFLPAASMLVLIFGLSGLMHLVLMRYFGARPQRRLKWFARTGPVLATWLTAEGHTFTAKQYATIGSVPVLTAPAAGFAFVVLTPLGVAFGAYLLLMYGLARLKSLWLSAIALRQPEGALFEERADGTRIYRPAQRGA